MTKQMFDLGLWQPLDSSLADVRFWFAQRFNPEHIALAIKSLVRESELPSIRQRLLLLRHRPIYSGK